MATLDEDEILGKAYDRRLAARLLTYLRPYRRLTALAIVLLVGAFLLEIVQPYLVKMAIDDHMAKRDLPGVARVSIAYLAALLGAFGCRYLEQYVMNLVGQRVMFDLRQQLFSHLLEQNIRFFTKNPIGRLMTRVTSDVDVLSELFSAGVVSIIEDILKLLGIMVILLWMDWRLALATFAVLPGVVFTAAVFRVRVRQ
ncbi:MAG TPA: ABC transporter ATP-binding protein, partial [Candidatus Udaeobacter sp.]|nr:ABC transporter ATP-binding protein [Candidatus Udaeobacter sp.]